ncbi:MAG: hypothetical protein RJA61_547 [Candidatus Parcubacteria bacterium]
MHLHGLLKKVSLRLRFIKNKTTPQKGWFYFRAVLNSALVAIASIKKNFNTSNTNKNVDNSFEST